MNCRSVRSLLSPYLDSELDAKATLAVGEHLATCAECRARFEGEEALERAIVGALDTDPLPVDVDQRLMQRLSAARRRNQWRWPALAAAAVVIVSVALALQDGSVEAPPGLMDDLVSAHDRAGPGAFHASERGDVLQLLATHGLSDVDLPADGTFGGHPIQLMGATATMFHGVRAVNVQYDCCGVLTSVFVMDRQAMAALPDDVQQPAASRSVDIDGAQAVSLDADGVFLGIVSRHSTELARHWSS